MNYLILSPEGAGSNFLLAALIVYLNAANLNYIEIRALSTSLEKKLPLGDKKLKNILNFLKSQKSKTVVRLEYKNLRKYQNTEEYKKFINELRLMNFKIFYLTKNHFENALSLAIRTPFDQSIGGMHARSISQKLQKAGEQVTYKVNLDDFNSQLEVYKDFENFIRDDFSEAIEIKYNDLNSNIDDVLAKMTGINNFVLDRFNLSINEYVKAMYQFSYTKFVDNTKARLAVKFIKYQDSLITQGNLIYRIPLKLNTLEEKIKKIVNFTECFNAYNQYASKTNYISKITYNDIETLICQEKVFYKNSLTQY